MCHYCSPSTFQAFEFLCCSSRRQKPFSPLCLSSFVLQTRGDIFPLSSFPLLLHRCDRLRLRYTAFLVIVVCTPAAAKAKKQLNRQQFPATLTRTTTQHLPLHLFFANSAKRCKPWCKWPGPKPTHIEPSSRAQSSATGKRIAPLVCAATAGDPKCIHLVNKIDSQKTSFIADTGSMVSIFKSTLVNTDYATSTTTNLKTVNGDRIKVHGKMTLTIATPPPTQLQFHLLHRRRQRQQSRTGFLERQRHKHQLPQVNSNGQRHQIHFDTQHFTRTTKSQPCSSRFSGPVSKNRHSSQKDYGTTFIKFRRRRFQHVMYSQQQASHRRFNST